MAPRKKKEEVDAPAAEAPVDAAIPAEEAAPAPEAPSKPSKMEVVVINGAIIAIGGALISPRPKQISLRYVISFVFTRDARFGPWCPNGLRLFLAFIVLPPPKSGASPLRKQIFLGKRNQATFRPSNAPRTVCRSPGRHGRPASSACAPKIATPQTVVVASAH